MCSVSDNYRDCFRAVEAEVITRQKLALGTWPSKLPASGLFLPSLVVLSSEMLRLPFELLALEAQEHRAAF